MTPNHRHGCGRRLATLTAAATTAAGLAFAVPLTPAATGADSQILAVDFGMTTGQFRGGASGTLYGLGDQGAPTPALLNGAHVTNTSQKPPFGTQHPSGDVFKIEDDFFAKHGKDLYVYMQDYYPDWPYYGANRPGDTRTYDLEAGSYAEGGNGVWDYLEVVEIVATRIAQDIKHPEDMVLIPFNEPDGIWYQDWGVMRGQFLEDWSAVHTLIREIFADHGHPGVRIGGPGDSRWYENRSADLLDYAEPIGQLPDVWIWHELGIDNLANFRGNLATYRGLEDARGIDDIPINITEYGMLRDMSVPGQLIQWFSMFEDAKVDAQTAYWNYAGNLSDNTAGPNGANGGWWLFKWYGDLEGSETVRVTPPQLNAVDTVQGIGAVDDQKRRATVLFGGTNEDVLLDLEGLDPLVFGDTVDVTVREIAHHGAEGLADNPPVVDAMDSVAVDGGRLEVSVDTYDRYAAYQVVITPDQNRDVEADLAAQPWSTSIEAEDTQLTAAQVYIQDPLSGGGWKFLASHGRDVGSFNQVSSRSDWTVNVPRTGTYRYQVIGATPGTPGRHALFVDGAFDQTVQYHADLALTNTHRWQYRGSTEVLVDLPAGEHTLSLRASKDGSTRLPNSDITLDKLSLTDVTQGTQHVYPASGYRLFGGASLNWSGDRGAVELSNGDRADLYVTSMDTGYHDVTINWSTDAANTVGLRVNGREVVDLEAPGAGSWTSTVRMNLVEGISEIELTSPGATVSELRTERVRAADDAQVSIEAEAMVRSGTAAVFNMGDGSGTNASGNTKVGFVGNGAANYLEVPRAAGFDAAGDYDLTVFYSNAETQGDHAYNPQVVDRRLDVTEVGHGLVGSEHFRYTYSWNSMSQRTIHLRLASGGNALRLGNVDAMAPDIDRVLMSPFVLGTPTTVEVVTPTEEPTPTPVDSPTVQPTVPPGVPPGVPPVVVTAPAATAPDRVARPRASVRGQRVVVRWTEPETGGAPITRYLVRVGTAKPRRVDGDVTRAVVKGLAPGRHTIRVAARNAVGTSAFSRRIVVRIR